MRYYPCVYKLVVAAAVSLPVGLPPIGIAQLWSGPEKPAVRSAHWLDSGKKCCRQMELTQI